MRTGLLNLRQVENGVRRRTPARFDAFGPAALTLAYFQLFQFANWPGELANLFNQERKCVVNSKYQISRVQTS